MDDDDNNSGAELSSMGVEPSSMGVDLSVGCESIELWA